MVKSWILVAALVMGIAAVYAEPPAEYGAPAQAQYGAPAQSHGGGYGGGGYDAGNSGGGWGGNDGGYSSGGGGGGYSSGGDGGWGSGSSSGGGGGGGWGSVLSSLKPKFRYINFRIPIPILPRIRFGIGAKINAHAAVQPASGGW